MMLHINHNRETKMRNKTILGLTAASFLLLLRSNAADNYKIDPAHTSVGFSVRNMGLSNVKGHFDEFVGAVVLNNGSIQEATATIQVKSVNTGNQKRDNHLRTADFFDADLNWSDIEDVREALRQIAVQTTRAADILGRLRALARTQRAEHALASVNALAAELHELVQADALLHGVELKFDLTPELPEVRVDSGQIQQAIMNLVRNSLDALAGWRQAGAHITIRTALTAQGEVELSVTDNGPGVPAEAMQRIFDPFFSTKENGTGLGLAITHSIGRAHGGTVGYRPNVPNGACFYMLLPTERD